MQRVLAMFIATVCALSVSACGLGSGGTVPFMVGPGSIQPNAALEGVKITVGSKEYTEQVIMGYILEYTLAAAGADVRDLTGIVGSRSTREAQLRGQVDVAYEFTGNAWINYLGHEKPIPDSREQYEAVRDEDLERNDMVWLPPGPMDDTYALAASKTVVERTGVLEKVEGAVGDHAGDGGHRVDPPGPAHPRSHERRAGQPGWSADERQQAQRGKGRAVAQRGGEGDRSCGRLAALCDRQEVRGGDAPPEERADDGAGGGAGDHLGGVGVPPQGGLECREGG